MSFFDQSSLCLIPSGYKDQKLYAVKPLDGSGDLTFSRASSATRVASNGLIEKVRTNVVTYSEAFDNAAWNKGNLSVSANSIANPIDGATTADTIVEAATTGTHYLYQSPSLTGEFTYSVYAKAKERDHIVIAGSINTTTFYSALFDLTNGLVEQQEKGSSNTLNAAIVAIGSGWYRCSVTITSATAIPFVIWTSDGSALSPTYYEPSYAGNGTSGVYVFGAQAESGVATDYIATTSAAVSVGPVSGLPRLDYLNSTCPRLLLEPQRTNLLTYSEQFDNAAYALNNATITANSVVSPDGYTNADTYTATGGGNYINGVATSAGSNTITYSVFAKAGTQNVFRIREANYFGSATIFNLSTGTVTSGTGTITSYGNGWYRCTHTQAYGAGQTFVSVIFDTTASSGTFYLYGAQFEVGAYATSYIPTLGTSVTRVADAASKSSINALIGGTSGTVFFEIKTNKTLTSTNFKQFFYYTDASASQAYMYLNGSNYIVTNTSLGNFTGSLQFQADTTYKVAIAYATNDFKLYINGVERGSSTSGTPINAVNLLSLGSYTGSAEFNEFVFSQYIHFPTRLSNSDLAALTA
jgi:hypothetical protein